MNIFFCGAGGTGKTTVLQDVAASLGLPVMGSVVREFYHRSGIASQVELDAYHPEGRRLFQTELMRYYLDKVEAFAAHPGGMVMDRSIYDHAAYALLADLDAGRELIDDIDAAFARFEKLHPVMVYFPYSPAWWDPHQNGEEDGFRNIRPAHDLLLDSVIRRWVVSPTSRRTFPVVVAPNETGMSPGDRAEGISSTLSAMTWR